MSDAPPPNTGSDRPDSIAIDVGEVLRGSVASLYAHLITRPTGRAVRMAIEAQLQGAGSPSLTLVDFSEVSILDFSCADEVVAKLLLGALEDRRADAFFVFRGVREPHRDQIEVVLERHGLAAVVETGEGSFELIGVHSEAEARAWSVLERRGSVEASQVAEVLESEDDRNALTTLGERRLAYADADGGPVHALSRLIDHLM